MKKILLLVIMLFLTGCSKKHISETLLFKTKKSTENIVLGYNSRYDKIVKIEIPFNIEVQNILNKPQYFTSIEYLYNSKNSGISIPLFRNIGKNKIRVKQSELKKIDPKQKVFFSSLTRHYIDTSANIQNLLKNYLIEFKTKKTDTIHINIKRFKLDYQNFIEQIMFGDSLLIRTKKKNSKIFNSRSLIVIPMKLEN